MINLRTADYKATLDRQAMMGLSGGSIYDALAVQAALKSGADQVVTLNGGDFRRVWPDGGERIVSL